MTKYLSLTTFLLFLIFTPSALAQSSDPETLPQDTFHKARVLEVVEEGSREGLGGQPSRYQIVRLKIEGGEQAGKTITVEHEGSFDLQESQKVSEGQTVTLTRSQTEEGAEYYINEPYRLNSLIVAFILFLLLVFAVARWQGLASVAGMAFSLFVIIRWALPAIAEGRSPFLVSLLATAAIALVSLYMAHGFKKRTTVALFSILITVGLSILIGFLLTQWSSLTGSGSEEAFSLQLFNLPNLDLKGLFLGSMVIGALGVLDDVATAQAATVEELKNANPLLDRKELYRRGMVVGREHISSLVNTLVLAYAGASFPLLITFYISSYLPVWVILNNEAMMEEVVRTLVGSSALILAVPITTALAAWAFGRNDEKLKI